MVDTIINEMKSIKNQYLKKITKLLKPTRSKLSPTYKIQFKNFFGAVGGYINGHLFISCGHFGVALRLSPETLDKIFKENGVKHLKYFPNGHTKKEYAVLPERILDSRHRLKKLVDESIKYVLSNK